MQIKERNQHLKNGSYFSLLVRDIEGIEVVFQIDRF